MATSLHTVKPELIQQELNRIWESLETTNTTRACLFNLVFYTERNHRTAYIQRIAQSVVKRFPARVIFVAANKDSKEDYLKTDVSILNSSTGENDVACDFIQIEAGGSSQQRIPFLILPHLISDLPVYLVWAEDPCLDDPLFQQLAKFSHRVIFDSETSESLTYFAASLLHHKTYTQTDIADLNWARIETWRDMLSSAFYSEDRLNKIRQAQTIKIIYNAQESAFFCHTQIQSFYVQAWLACQLDWAFERATKEKGEISLFYTSSQLPIRIDLTQASYPQLPPGLILSLEVTTRDGDHFQFQRNLESIHQITLIASSKDRCEMPCNYIFAKAESGHSLVKEICHRGTSEHFLKVLSHLKQMNMQDLC